MSAQHQHMRPTVAEIRSGSPADRERVLARPAQRDLVLASLLRCPATRSKKSAGRA